MGFAGNLDPQFIIPTAMTVPEGGTNNLNFLTGFEASEAASTSQVVYPIRHGQVENWDWMESYWQHCLFKYLRCDPEEHFFMLTEPPLNAPENREGRDTWPKPVPASKWPDPWQRRAEAGRRW